MPLGVFASVALAALAGLVGPVGEAPPAQILGAHFDVDVRSTATRGPLGQRGVATARTAGAVDVAVTGLVRVGGSFRPPGASASRTYAADALHWQLDVAGKRTTLELRFRVTATSDPSRCPVGARGVLRAVDDDTRFESGRRRDSVRVSFTGSACRDFVRAWSNGPAPLGTARARVEIDVEKT